MQLLARAVSWEVSEFTVCSPTITHLGIYYAEILAHEKIHVQTLLAKIPYVLVGTVVHSLSQVKKNQGI